MSSADSFSRLDSVQRWFLAVDLVLFTVIGGRLCVMMGEREQDPFRNYFALPGRLLGNQAIEAGAKAILWDTLHLPLAVIEQFHTFSEPGRDPRGAVASTAFIGALPYEYIIELCDTTCWQLLDVEPGSPEGSVVISCEGMPMKPAFDHGQILARAIGHMRASLGYSLLPFHILPYWFTLQDLQDVHEAILGQRLNKPLFRKRMLGRTFADGSRLVPSGTYHRQGPHRPAQLYVRKVPKPGQ